MTAVVITIAIILPGKLSQEAPDGLLEIVLRCLSENVGLCLQSLNTGRCGHAWEAESNPCT